MKLPAHHQQLRTKNFDPVLSTLMTVEPHKISIHTEQQRVKVAFIFSCKLTIHPPGQEGKQTAPRKWIAAFVMA